MGSSVRYTKSKMKLLALIAASAYAFDSITKDDANRYAVPDGFQMTDGGIMDKATGFCPMVENGASLNAVTSVAWTQCSGIENALCEYTFKYNQDGSVISVSGQCKDRAACHDNMRQNFDKNNQILSKCQVGPDWPTNLRNGRYGAQDFQCTMCRNRLLDTPDATAKTTEQGAIQDLVDLGSWNSQA